MSAPTTDLTRSDADDQLAVWFTGEVFECGNWRWDIDRARVVVAESRRKPVAVDVAEFASLIGPLVDINRGPCAPVDLTVPILVVELAEPVDGHHRLLIDGYHRIMAATSEGISTLPAYVLTADESLNVGERYPECNGCGHCGHFPFDPDEDYLRCSRRCVECSRASEGDDRITKVRKLVGRYMHDRAFRTEHPACVFCDADLAIRKADPDVQLEVDLYHEIGCPMNPDTPKPGNRASRRAARRSRKGGAA